LSTTSGEIRRNYEEFEAASFAELGKARRELVSSTGRFASNYRRIVSINAWRSLIELIEPKDAVLFFTEAQNDALLSNVLARCGSWRTALQCLRSVIENVIYFIYYKDHPVELRMWGSGRHKLTAQVVFDYLRSHPEFRGIPPTVSGIDALQDEYSTLSKAVHGSAIGFRMTAQGDVPVIASSSPASMGAWATRETATLIGVNSILLVLFRAQLKGAGHRGLRESIAFVLPKKRHAAIRTATSVALDVS